MSEAQVAYLADGRRLHMHHGPIDLIVDVVGDGRAAALARAEARFEGVLQELVDELDILRKPTLEGRRFSGLVAQNMQAVTQDYLPAFVTPMAAVAGAVADEIARAIGDGSGVDTAYVNNGGDVAMVLSAGHSLTAALGDGVGNRLGRAQIAASEPIRGVATSGWRGRSLSLGIADAVTVLARDAAQADVAATMIANHVDLVGHPEITRQPAHMIFEDSDLGGLLVTVEVGGLSEVETKQALEQGADYAESCLELGLIRGALLALNGQYRAVGAPDLLQINKDLMDA